MTDNERTQGQPNARGKRGDRDWPRDPDEQGSRDLQRERERTEGRGESRQGGSRSRTHTQEDKDKAR
jgi:hypothetical protein